MKNMLIIVLLLCGLAAVPAALSQTTVADTNQVAQAAAPPADPGAAATVEPPATNATLVSVAATNPPVAPPVASKPADAAAASSIPLIQFQDVPITTAIENLARQAGINYLIDPRIGYGQPDQNGVVKPEPTLSIRWENISAEHALLALLDNYGLQLTRDKNTLIGRISAKDPAAPPPLITRVIQLKYASSSNMVEHVQAALTDKRSKVLADNRTSQLVVVATDPEQTAVDTLVAQLDIANKQVLIEARFVEISSTPESKKGVDWSGTLSGQNISYGNGTLNAAQSSTATSIPGTPVSVPGFGGHPATTTQSGSSSQTLLSTIPGSGFALNTASGLTPNIGFLNADGLHAVLSFINSSLDASVVSTPRIVTLDNETANLAVTRTYPIFNVQAGSANASGGSSVTYSNIGTSLQVTPRISANDYIWLRVVPEVSSFFGNFSQSVNGGTGASGNPVSLLLTAPQFDQRTFTTQVRIPNANTLVMGGLVNDSPKSQTTKVPVMGDLPLLGHLFRSEDKSSEKDNLLIFITPTIVQDSDFQPNTTDFLKSRPDAKKPVWLDQKSAWDNTKPYYNDKFHPATTASN
jgi:type II secretory pathway component GspD/PulD (secretin)